MLKITAVKANGSEYTIIIRKKWDGYYASNPHGQLMQDKFKTVDEAIAYAYELLPNVFES